MAQSKSLPVVSIIIPAYNAHLYIGATLESAVKQTFRSFEIIVVDDGSTDDTQSIAQNFYDRGVTVISQSNAGPAAARNRALSIARGEYVALLDADDIWEPDYLQTMVGFLNSHPEVSIAFSEFSVFWQIEVQRKEISGGLSPMHPHYLCETGGANISCIRCSYNKKGNFRPYWFF